MNQLTNEELNNIKVLVGNAQIKGADALTVALLIQKLDVIINSQTPPEIKPETSTKEE